VTSRYGIAEWFGKPFLTLSAKDRRKLAKKALREESRIPPCPFQEDRPPCRKRGGVCSLQRYEGDTGNRISQAVGDPVVVCPARFEEGHMLVSWLAEIVGFSEVETKLAREVPFMEGTSTGRPAGKIDMVVARTSESSLVWYGLEIQAVYFSGPGMDSEYQTLRNDICAEPPFPGGVRRPDWRSSSAKRLMPQLQIKVPTLRRWGSKLAVAVDQPFFESMGGPSPNPSRDLNDGDILWLVPEWSSRSNGGHALSRGHWEVLTLEDSSRKLLAARTISRGAFEQTLRNKLVPLGCSKSAGL
jgi:hypothetical protein